MVKKIPLQNGDFALVDDDVYEMVSKHIWTVTSQGTTYIVQSTIKDELIILSRLIMGATDSEMVYFKNGNNLDCRKENMLVGDRSLINKVRRGRRKSASKYKGVTWVKRDNRWKAQIGVGEKTKYLGTYSSEDEAAKAYNKAALEYHGEHAYVNVIGVDNRAVDVKVNRENVQMRSRTGQCGFRGVTKARSKGKFQAQIGVNYKKIYLGTYDTPEQAAKAYDRKSYELFGENALLNFPNLIAEYKGEGDSS